MPCRWTFKKSISLESDKTLCKLVQFYVLETPVKDVSQKGKSFRELGWRGAGDFSRLHAQMREGSKSFFEPKHWVVCAAKDVRSELEKLDRASSYDCSFEFAIHTQKDKLNKTEALFYMIRNGFAHGGFRIHEYQGERYFAFENRDKGLLKGRAVLAEKTLLSWRLAVLEKRLS